MRSLPSVSLIGLFALTGCQGVGGYSAQNVTRVPPINTGSYQVPGSYYGSTPAAPAPSNAASNLPSGSIGPASATSDNYTSSTMTAQYELPSTAAVGSGVTNAGTSPIR